jgi:serine/threonine protein kinase, bacterial
VSRIRLEVGSEPFPGLKLVQLLGRGGFAEVWEGLSSQGERLAVKFMASRNSASSVKEMRILQAIQKIAHRNVLRIYNVWSIPDYIVVSMEVADGSLFDLLDVYTTEYHTAMGPSLVIGYLRQAAAALDYLNTRQHNFDNRKVGFQHCDVKPSNLLLIGEMVKLADFGLCTPTVALQSSYGRAGTLDFAAPEVHRGNLADSSDQYSLAVTYFYLRTATLPFPAAPSDFKREYSYSRPAPELGRVRRGERRVLERALDLEPTNRWPNCSTLIAALDDAVRKEDPEPSQRSTEIRLAGSAL